MLYKKNSASALSDELFKNPTAEYRGTPFWAWNSELTKDELERQIDVFGEMGFGGFHMHVRTGLKNRYLSDEYMQLVKDCVAKAEDNDMLAWLYDEDRWASGAAGGLVTKDKKYRARAMYFTNDEEDAAARGEDDTLVACYDVALNPDGTLKTYRRIEEDEKAKGTKWFALQRLSTPSSWYNGQTYVDTLNREAMEQFVRVTHERYKEAVGDAFGKTVPAIFTDEPQFTSKTTLKNSMAPRKTWVRLPWTDRVPELYRQTFGEDILATLPELIWDLPEGRVSVPRYRFHDFIAELFAASFADTVGGWCSKNGIALTGHMMEEPSLRSQTAIIGEAMRSYRSFGIPGIDMLCNNHEFTTAKQAQSAAHQFGRPGVLSELYGVTGWDCDFRTYKHQGDWQAALGITVRVPHLSWYAMGGEAKRDYPASIHYQSPWYQKYRLVEDHFARVNTAMTRGKPVVKVGVIHPVESFWLHWGPNDKSALLRESLDERFENVTHWLLEGSIDFNFIAESLLPSLCKTGGAPLQVGKMAYDAVVVPGCETLRASTLERLEAFRKAGGKLIFMGDAPTLCDAVASDRGAALCAQSERIDFSRAALLTALEDCRTVTLRYADGRLTGDLLYQMRQDGEVKWLFLAHTCEPRNKDVDRAEEICVTINGDYAVSLYDTANGEITALPAEYSGGKTAVTYRLERYDSLLLKLLPGKAETIAAKERCNLTEGTYAPGVVAYSLSEPNVLLLDMAEYKLSGDKDYSSAEEILRLDNICRDRLGLPKRGGAIVQPWVAGDVPDVDTLTLRFTFESEIDYAGAFLALEMAQKAQITFNGAPVKSESAGKYVDIDIDKIALPPIVKGKNTLVVTYPFGETSDIENMFILGDFGVKLIGDRAVITALPGKIGFGDLTRQGFPFYGGNVTYQFTTPSRDGRLTIRASWYRGAVISVAVDGKECGDIVYPPYVLDVDGLADGEHEVALTLYIHRYNTFGPVHLVDEGANWHGPGAWRSEGNEWTYEYVLRRTGILSAPEIF